MRKCAVHRRRGNARKARRVRACRFSVEQLEDRRLLAADFLAGGMLGEGEGEDALVAINLSTSDLVGNPITSIAAGQRFLVRAHVEDLRDDPAGVFAAYFDIEFDPNDATIVGPIVPAAGFQNVISGSVEKSGLIDEAGGTSTTLFPSGATGGEVFTVLLTANTVGELELDAGPADILPEHFVLLYDLNTPVPMDFIAFGHVTIEVTPFESEPSVATNDDSYVVQAGSGVNRFDVLANDEGFGNLIVTAVDDTGLTGDVSIAANGQDLIYSPNASFSGVESFLYTATNENGESDVATVTVTVNAAIPGNDLVVSIRLEATDLSGAPIVSITEGNDFLLKAFVQDTRPSPEGIFAAYIDLTYDSGLTAPNGEIEFSSQFINGFSGDFETIGLVNEVGGFQQSFRPFLGGESHLFTIRFSALGTGQARFETDPTEDIPLHDVLLYGVNEPVSSEHISYGTFTLDIHSNVIAVDDSFHIAEDTTVELRVLSNDVHIADDELLIREVDDRSLRGTVSVSQDGKALIYTPPAGYGGTEQFSYLVEGLSGFDSAQVTVHTDPGAAHDDVVAFELATTDLIGNPIDSIEAGEQFWLTVSVDDLREENQEDDLGVFSAYFDLLYNADHVSVVGSEEHRPGFDVTFGSDYVNGQQGRSSVPGVIDEVGAFQTELQPLGGDRLTLFAVRLEAKHGGGGDDTFIVQEDAQLVSLNVLANDVEFDATTVFRSDPADVPAVSDVLLFNPPRAVDAAEIHFGETSLRVHSRGSGSPTITSVGPTSHGGLVALSVDGQRLEYTPTPDFFGSETFTYAIDHGPSIDVEIVVTGVADAPRAHDDSYRVRANHTLMLDTLQGPLANDIDADGDTLGVTAVTGPQHGTLEIMDDGSFVYVPDHNFFGSDQFTYRAVDGGLVSTLATVDIHVEPPPVQIRLEVVDADGTLKSHVVAGDTLFLKALVQDLRDDSQPYHGVGAAYLDVTFDPTQIAPVLADNEYFDVAIDFSDAYQNGRSVSPSVAGLLNNVGAFQTGFAPLGPDEIDLFTVEMAITELKIANDEYTISMNSRVNKLDVLANEINLTWDVQFDAQPADDGPLTEVVLYDPPMVVEGDDIAYGDASVTVSNGADLVILRVGTTRNGGSVTVTNQGKRIRYTPRREFTGVDSFKYTVVNGQGIMGTGTVTLEVVESWQNQHNIYDVTSNGEASALDALALINSLNRYGARQLGMNYLGPHFYDVNSDNFLSPQDVLTFLNWLNSRYSEFGASAEAEAPAATSSGLVVEVGENALVSLGLNDPLDAGQLERVERQSSAAWQQEHIESAHPAVTPDMAAMERRWRLFSQRFESGEDAETDDDLIDGLDQLAEDVAPFWAVQN